MKKEIYEKRVEWEYKFTNVPDGFFVYSFFLMLLFMILSIIDFYHIYFALAIGITCMILTIRKRKVYLVRVK